MRRSEKRRASPEGLNNILTKKQKVQPTLDKVPVYGAGVFWREGEPKAERIEGSEFLDSSDFIWYENNRAQEDTINDSLEEEINTNAQQLAETIGEPMFLSNAFKSVANLIERIDSYPKVKDLYQQFKASEKYRTATSIVNDCKNEFFINCFATSLLSFSLLVNFSAIRHSATMLMYRSFDTYIVPPFNLASSFLSSSYLAAKPILGDNVLDLVYNTKDIVLEAIQNAPSRCDIVSTGLGLSLAAFQGKSAYRTWEKFGELEKLENTTYKSKYLVVGLEAVCTASTLLHSTALITVPPVYLASSAVLYCISHYVIQPMFDKYASQYSQIEQLKKENRRLAKGKDKLSDGDEQLQIDEKPEYIFKSSPTSYAHSSSSSSSSCSYTR
ncbi:hypothetical protein H1Q59_03590 [Holosporaceae bacterium 'Namur']|nr:hypothetical protein [Holosporaceae bacterium 'Namur']